jgi:hypothetical protein
LVLINKMSNTKEKLDEAVTVLKDNLGTIKEKEREKKMTGISLTP